jgi:hypothetical protein
MLLSTFLDGVLTRGLLRYLPVIVLFEFVVFQFKICVQSASGIIKHFCATAKQLRTAFAEISSLCYKFVNFKLQYKYRLSIMSYVSHMFLANKLYMEMFQMFNKNCSGDWTKILRPVAWKILSHSCKPRTFYQIHTRIYSSSQVAMY